MKKIRELEHILTDKINYLTHHPNDINVKKLPGLVEALKDLHEVMIKENVIE